jgi:hypothetical protein
VTPSTLPPQRFHTTKTRSGHRAEEAATGLVVADFQDAKALLDQLA